MPAAPDLVSPFAACERLFRDYPLANEQAGPRDVARMVLVTPEQDLRSFTLTRPEGGRFQMCPWNGRPADGPAIRPGTESMPEDYWEVLASGVPLPRDGSMFGEAVGGEITALHLIYTRRTETNSRPGFSTLLRAGSPPSGWPQPNVTFGSWFWAEYEAGQIVSLADTVADLDEGRVFWSGMLIPGGGSGLIAVTGPVSCPRGYCLPAGVYAYHETLRASGNVPPLAEVLADPRKTDLTPRFW